MKLHRQNTNRWAGKWNGRLRGQDRKRMTLQLDAGVEVYNLLCSFHTYYILPYSEMKDQSGALRCWILFFASLRNNKSRGSRSDR